MKQVSTMNKNELFSYILRLQNENKNVKQNNVFLLQQQNELKTMAELSGSEKAAIKRELLLLKEEFLELQNKLSGLKVSKNAKK